jgi:hypothetical protein
LLKTTLGHRPFNAPTQQDIHPSPFGYIICNYFILAIMMMQSQALRASSIRGQALVATSQQRAVLVGRQAKLQVECRSLEAGMF